MSKTEWAGLLLVKRATQVEVHGDGWICCYKCREGYLRWFELER